MFLSSICYHQYNIPTYQNSYMVLQDKYPNMKRSWYYIIDRETKDTVYDNKDICALIWVESRFNEKAVSPSGARNLTQIMPYHGIYNAEQSIVWTIKHLQKECLKTAKGNKVLSYAYYHGGNGRKFLRRIDQKYVISILSRV